MNFWCPELPLSSLKHEQDNVETPCLITGWSYIHLITSGFLYLILMYNFKNLTKLKGFLIILFLHTLYEIKDLGYYMGFLRQSEWLDNSPLNSIGSKGSSKVSFSNSKELPNRGTDFINDEICKTYK